MESIEETLRVDKEKLDRLYQKIHSWMETKSEDTLHELTDSLEKIAAFSLATQKFDQDLNTNTTEKLFALMSSAIIFGYAIRELEMIEGKGFWEI